VPDRPSGDEAGGAIPRLRRLRGVRWDWRDDAPPDAHERPGLGVLAQEVEAEFPELIEYGDDGFLKVEYDGLVPPLMLAVGELNARLEKLGQRERSGVSDELPERLAAATQGEVRTELDPDQVEKVFPDLVVTNEEGEREVAYEGLVGLLIEAVRELDGRVSALEQES
jgi:endosialidase-like protein